MISRTSSPPLVGLILGVVLIGGLVSCERSRPDGVDPKQVSTPETLSTFTADLLNDPDRIRRMLRLTNLIESLPAERLPELATAIESRAVMPRQEDIGLVMHAWARVDPQSAFDQALAWKRGGIAWDPVTSSHAVYEVLYVWAQDATANAGVAFAELPQQLLLGGHVAVVRGWTESGQMARATQHLLDVDEVLQQTLFAVVAERLVADEGVERAIAFAKGVPDSLLLTAHRRTARAVARVDPDRATAWTTENLEQPYGSGMAKFVATEWARQAGAETALAWLDTLPNEQEQQRAATAVLQNWRIAAPEAAMTWLQQRNPLEMRYRPVLTTHVMALYTQGPQQALRWIEGMSDPTFRHEAELTLAINWITADEKAAWEWIREVGLEQAVKENIASRKKKQAQRKRQAAQSGPT